MESLLSPTTSSAPLKGGGRQLSSPPLRSAPLDPDVYNQLGSCLFKQGFFGAALSAGFIKCRFLVSGLSSSSLSRDLSDVVGGGGLPALCNMLGLCYAAVGNFVDGDVAFEEAAVRAKGDFKEALANRAQLKKDYGEAECAIELFDKAILVDKEYVHAIMLRGLCHFSMGGLVS